MSWLADSVNLNRVSAPLCWIAVLFWCGCAGTPERRPLPESLQDPLIVRGMRDVRMWGDEIQDWQQKWLTASEAELEKDFPDVRRRAHHYLALSGGGQFGAFGAGVMKGWTASGTRPEFTIVTGISVGALIAPFAFLGPEYDETLEQTFTGLHTKDVARVNGLIGIQKYDALTNNLPLRKQLEKYFTMEVLRKIAAEHRRGRRLFVGTTQLDAQRPVIWSLGAIALHDSPEALRLAHDVILASTAVPGVFPPLLLELEAGGERYDEVHVDGGMTQVIFFLPPEVDFASLVSRMQVKGRPQLYLVANQYLQPGWDPVELKLTEISLRSMLLVVANQTLGDLYRIFAQSVRDGLDLHLTWIPSEIENNPREPFDPEFMGRLFEAGVETGKKVQSWDRIPPGWEGDSSPTGRVMSR